MYIGGYNNYIRCNVMQAWEMYISGKNNYVRSRMQCDTGLGYVH